MKSPCGIEIKIGQKWREMDTRFWTSQRIVEVVGYDPHLKRVQIQNVRITWASLHRFHGKNGGYKYVSG
jgi:hypothetical protein